MAGGGAQTSGILPVNILCSAQLSRCPDPGRRECRVPPFSYRSAVRWSAPSPPARAPRDGRVHQPVGARRARGRRRRRRGGSLCRRLGHGQLHPRSARLPGGAQVGRHGSGSGGAALPGGRPQPPAAPAAALGPSGGDPAGNALIFVRGLSQPGLGRWWGAGALSPFSSRMMRQTRREPLSKGPCASFVRPAKVTPPSFTIADRGCP